MGYGPTPRLALGSVIGAWRSSTSRRSVPSRWNRPTAATSSPTTARSTTLPNCARNWSRPARASAAAPTPKSSSRASCAGASRRRSRAAWACSLSRCGTGGRARCTSSATGSASSRSIMHTTIHGCCSDRNSRRCAPSPTGSRPSTATRSPDTRATRLCRRPEDDLCRSPQASARPHPRMGRRCGAAPLRLLGRARGSHAGSRAVECAARRSGHA